MCPTTEIKRIIITSMSRDNYIFSFLYEKRGLVLNKPGVGEGEGRVICIIGCHNAYFYISQPADCSSDSSALARGGGRGWPREGTSYRGGYFIFYTVRDGAQR